ncbi:hypothetical protein M405DRAFT_932026 [Rhizopogon salebrosus TDB-379]|nr:hypothetical protein M405DRAFT_932026 [Rhizopogon salebrosus TDB-379]
MRKSEMMEKGEREWEWEWEREREKERDRERQRKWEREWEREREKVKRKEEKARRTQRREAGLDDLLSNSSTQAGTSQNAASTSIQSPSDTRNTSEDMRPPPTNADSTSFLDADATQPLSDTLPEGFFSDIHPPPTTPVRCSRPALVDRLSLLYRTVRAATPHNMPIPSIPLNLTRSRAIFSRYQLRRNQPNIKLERFPKKAEVSYT